MRRLPLQKSPLKRSRGTPILKASSRSAAFSGPPDLSRRKRVKLAGSTGLRERGGREGNPYEGARLSSFYEAKTSEYKSFKRLLEKAAHVHYADKFDKNDTKLKTIKATSCLEGSRSAITSKTGIGRSLLLKRNASYVEDVLYSPVQNSDRHESKCGATRSVEPSKVTPSTQLSHSSASAVWQNYDGHSAKSHELEGTFSGKRLHLIQLAARTCSQQVDEFLSKRSDFFLESLQRLGITTKPSKFDVLQESEQTTDAQFPTSSNKSNCTFESCDNQLKSLYPSRHGSDYGWLNLACSKKVLCQEPVFKLNKKADTVDHDQEEHAMAIESSRGFDCNYYRYHHLDWTDCSVTNYLCQNPHSSISLVPNGMYEFCIGEKSYPLINSEAEIGFQELQLVPFSNEFTNSFDNIQSPGLNLMPCEEKLTDSLLDLKAISVQEHPPPVFVPKDVDCFPITMRVDSGFPYSAGSPCLTDFYQSTGFYSLKNSSFDLRLPDSAHCSLLTVKCLQNFSDGSDHSPVGVDFTLDMSKQSDGFGCFLNGNICNIPEDELNSMGSPNKLPVKISSFRESPSLCEETYFGSFQID